jgi:hypothetical protein
MEDDMQKLIAEVINSVIAVIETISKIPSYMKKLFPKLTFFSRYDHWLYVTIGDTKVCKQCSPHDGMMFEGDLIRNKFPWLEVEGSDTIHPHVHPNCRCVMLRAETLYGENPDLPFIEPGMLSPTDVPEIPPQVGLPSGAVPEPIKTPTIVGTSGYEGGYDPKYTKSPMEIHGGATSKELKTFNSEFKKTYNESTELYRGVRSEKALDDLLNTGVLQNKNADTPVSLSINPSLAQAFTSQKENGIVMVFDKDKLDSQIIVPKYTDISTMDRPTLDRSTKELPYWVADQEEVRGYSIKLPDGALKGILCNTEEGVTYYKNKYPYLDVKKVPDKILYG